MEERRRSGNWEQGADNKNRGWPTRPPMHGRPPHPSGPWHSTVPSWEKRFCSSVCSIPWKKICATKAVMSIYKNVVEWDDSAALQAFQNAKARFWADINGLPRNIPLPDPDMYIDEVDHKAVIDAQLVADLEKKPPVHPDGNNDASSGWDSFLFANKPVPVSGWDDAEEPIHTSDNKLELQSVNWDLYIEKPSAEKPLPATGWGDGVDPMTQNGDSSNEWNNSSGWGYGIVHDGSWGTAGNNYSWDNDRGNSLEHWDNRNDQTVKRNGRKRNGGQHGSRLTRSRYQVDDNNQTNSSWKNARERNKADYYVKSVHANQPLPMRQWKSERSCGPMNHHRAAESGGGWHWEKSIS